MRRKDLDYAVIALMTLSGLYTAASGLVSDLYGLRRFVLHAAAGYVCTACVLLHLALNWQRVRAYLRRRWRRRPTPRPEAPASAARGASRREVLAGGLGMVGGFALGRLLPPLMPGRAALPADENDLGALYHRWSKPGGAGLSGLVQNWGAAPGRSAPRTSAPPIALPDPSAYRGPSFEETMAARRSIRSASDTPLTLQELSQVLYAAQGITEPSRGFRAAPSAGALYPLETFIFIYNAEGLEPGLYHYQPDGHQLALIKAGNFRLEVIALGLGQTFLGQTGACIVLAAVWQRTRWRYRERTYRYVLLEAGHAAQNIYLAATSLGLGTCAVGAFMDDALNALLELEAEAEDALYMLSLGPRS